MAYALQEAFKVDLDRFEKKQQIIIPLGVDKASLWCNNSVLVPKPNDEVRMWLDPARVHQVLIWPIHRGPTTNDMFSNSHIHNNLLL